MVQDLSRWYAVFKRIQLNIFDFMWNSCKLFLMIVKMPNLQIENIPRIVLSIARMWSFWNLSRIYRALVKSSKVFDGPYIKNDGEKYKKIHFMFLNFFHKLIFYLSTWSSIDKRNRNFAIFWKTKILLNNFSKNFLLKQFIWWKKITVKSKFCKLQS